MMDKPQRGLTVRGAIKRLYGITIKEMQDLGVRDLRNILKLQIIQLAAHNELAQRELNKKVFTHVQQDA